MPGQIDFAFGKDGVVQINVPGASGSHVVSVINGPDDTLYVAGTALLEGASKFFITELNSAGDVISGFGDNGYVIDMFDEKNEDAYASQLVLSGKKLLLVGSSYIGTDPFPALAKLDLQGNFDTTFGEVKWLSHFPGHLAPLPTRIVQTHSNPTPRAMRPQREAQSTCWTTGRSCSLTIFSG
jgi:hypothetical protein